MSTEDHYCFISLKDRIMKYFYIAEYLAALEILKETGKTPAEISKQFRHVNTRILANMATDLGLLK